MKYQDLRILQIASIYERISHHCFFLELVIVRSNALQDWELPNDRPELTATELADIQVDITVRKGGVDSKITERMTREQSISGSVNAAKGKTSNILDSKIQEGRLMPRTRGTFSTAELFSIFVRKDYINGSGKSILVLRTAVIGERCW